MWSSEFTGWLEYDRYKAELEKLARAEAETSARAADTVQNPKRRR